MYGIPYSAGKTFQINIHLCLRQSPSDHSPITPSVLHNPSQLQPRGRAYEALHQGNRLGSVQVIIEDRRRQDKLLPMGTTLKVPKGF